MHKLSALLLSVLITTSAAAQTTAKTAPPTKAAAPAKAATAAAQTPAPVQIVTAANLAALVGKQSKDSNGFAPFIQLAPYSVGMEHRIKGQGAAVHEHDAELFYVIDGSGTLVTGGKLVNEKRTNDSNLSGTAIQGGVSRTVSKGDWIIVPEGVPHQFPTVQGLTLMSVHLPRKP
jgi:mannose-6-phosphate isomerase-like protein (cupin superfamily)